MHVQLCETKCASLIFLKVYIWLHFTFFDSVDFEQNNTECYSIHRLMLFIFFPTFGVCWNNWITYTLHSRRLIWHLTPTYLPNAFVVVVVVVFVLFFVLFCFVFLLFCFVLFCYVLFCFVFVMLLKSTNGRQKTCEIFHVYCIFYSGFMCQTTVIFGITKDGSLVLNPLCTRQRASWTYPPQVFTSFHLSNKIVRSGFTINSPLSQNKWVKFHHRKNKVGWRFTTAKIKLGEDSPSWFVFFYVKIHFKIKKTIKQ